MSLIVLIALISLQPALGVECTSIRIGLTHTPSDQGELNTCYAHVAVTMVDAVLAQAQPTSVLNTALGANEESGETPEWGRPCEAINHLRFSTQCSENEIPNVFKRRTPLNDLGWYYRWYRSLGSSSFAETVVVNSIYDYLVHELKLAENRVPSKDELAALLKQENPTTYLRAIVAYQCFKRLKTPRQIPACHEVDIQHAGLAETMIHDLLETRPLLPVGITFCMQTLTEKTSDGLRNGVPSEKCNPHSAVIVGRQQKNGTCQFLVRNSWGTACTRYHPSLQCQNGEVWIDASALTRNTYQISHLK